PSLSAAQPAAWLRGGRGRCLSLDTRQPLLYRAGRLIHRRMHHAEYFHSVTHNTVDDQVRQPGDGKLPCPRNVAGTARFGETGQVLGGVANAEKHIPCRRRVTGTNVLMDSI